MYPAPNPKQERQRIESNGGVVMPSRMPGVGYVGPARVWDRSQRYGLACSRSMGDTVRPTLQPTLHPSLQPTLHPTLHPTLRPTLQHTLRPATRSGRSQPRAARAVTTRAPCAACRSM